jgi:hypothetical protein
LKTLPLEVGQYIVFGLDVKPIGCELHEVLVLPSTIKLYGLFCALMALASLVSFQGQKSLDFRAHPFQWPSVYSARIKIITSGAI